MQFEEPVSLSEKASRGIENDPTPTLILAGEMLTANNDLQYMELERQLMQPEPRPIYRRRQVPPVFRSACVPF